MPETVDIPIADLLLDLKNPRFKEVPKSQQEAAQELAEKHGEHVVELAEDVVKHGLDPTTLPAVVASGDTRQRYRMLEGNRRLLAIKALETPTLISGVLSSGLAKRLTELSKAYAKKPISTMPCVLFATEDEARHWIVVRHTGANKGVGLVTWGAEEKERFESRHTGRLKPAGQVIKFVEKHGELSSEAQTSTQGISTNLARLVETTAVREKLGIDLDDGDVVSYYPLEEVVKGLTRIVEDLKTQKLKVPDLYHVKDRKKYVDGFPSGALPKKKTILDEPVVLSDLTEGKKPRKVKPRKKKKTRPKPPRSTVASGSSLNIAPPRINAIYNELLEITTEKPPNACAVLLRVFVELSVDHLIEEQKLMSENDLRNKPLKTRLKVVTKHFKDSGAISGTLKKAIDSIADGQSVLAPGLPTFNLYVHNKYAFPKPAEQFAAWDELLPFLEKLWP